MSVGDHTKYSKHTPIDWERFGRAVANLNDPIQLAQGLKVAATLGVGREAQHMAGDQIERSGEVITEITKVLELQNKIQELTWEELSTIAFHLVCMVTYAARDENQLARLLKLLQMQHEVSGMAIEYMQVGADVTKPYRP